LLRLGSKKQKGLRKEKVLPRITLWLRLPVNEEDKNFKGLKLVLEILTRVCQRMK
jgi:hypothetical protein